MESESPAPAPAPAPPPPSVATEVTQLHDGFYAFTTNDSSQPDQMVYNPGIQDIQYPKKKTFNRENSEEIPGEVMKTTFDKLRELCVSGVLDESVVLDALTLFYTPGSRALYLLSGKIVSSTYGDFISYETWGKGKGRASISPSQKLNAILEGNSIFYVDYVEVNPDYFGRGLCKPTLSFLLSYLLHQRSAKFIAIWNVSQTPGNSERPADAGVPACYCYLRAGQENDLIIYNQEGEQITDDKCQELIQNRDNKYYYVSQVGGGKKRRKKTRKKKTRRKKPRRKNKSGTNRIYSKRRYSKNLRMNGDRKNKKTRKKKELN